MAQTSVYRVRFSLVNTAGKVTGGPYTTNIGIAGGSRGDVHTVGVAASLSTAVTSNLASIMAAMGAGSGAPGGTVQIDGYDHASAPDLWS
jgi:hypothetical protein